MEKTKEPSKSYIPQSNYSSLLSEAVKRHTKSGMYIIITGESGCGKSSLLADWWEGFKTSSNILTLMFVIGKLLLFINRLLIFLLRISFLLQS